MAATPRILLLFVDGVGLAPASADNPFSRATTPSLRRVLGGPLTVEQLQGHPDRQLVALDATLDTPGLPQSATGQTALFTGVNGAAALGRHVAAFPGPRLRSIIEESSLFLRVVRAGLEATFANAFSRRYFELVEARRLRRSVTVCATLAADLPLRGVTELERGEAVSWDIVRDRFVRANGEAVPTVSAEEAGRDLARLAARHRLTVFETFLTDLAGHRRAGISVAETLARVDGLLSGVLSELPGDVTLVLTSDHGNIEDATHPRHTLNPVPLLSVGPLAVEFGGLSSVLEVTPAILSCLGVEEAKTTTPASAGGSVVPGETVA